MTTFKQALERHLAHRAFSIELNDFYARKDERREFWDAQSQAEPEDVREARLRAALKRLLEDAGEEVEE